MNNSEHDPANPHSDNEDADRGIHDSTGNGAPGPAAGGGHHDSGGDGDIHDSADGAPDGAAARDPENAGTDGSAASPSDDEVWRDLVARLESTDSTPDDLEDTEPSRRPGDPSRPGQPPSPGDPSRPGQPPSPGDPSPRREAPPGSRRYGQEHLGGPRDYTPEEEEDGYVPEDPPSLAGAEPLAVLAWIGAVGGPLALLLSAFFFRSIPMLAVVGIVAVFVGSVVFLLMRLPSERGDDHDDGAIV